MPSREDARSTRAESRERRRKESAQSPEEPREPASDDNGSSEGESMNAVKQAAKVAAVGAAVGAATAAARAFSSHDRGDEDTSNPDEAQPAPSDDASEPDEAQQSEQDEDEATSEDASGASSENPEDHAPGGDRAREGEEPAPTREQEQEPVAGAEPGDIAGAARKAREQLRAVLDRDAESVSALERTRDGWLVTLEVLELSRIPESTDVLASYEVDLDSDLGLRRYARVRRYIRSQADGGERG